MGSVRVCDENVSDVPASNGTEIREHRDIVWKPATWHVSRVALKGSASTHVLVIVWIVYGSRFDPTRAPTECRVTLGTIHLITPVNLENHGGALGAVARVLGQELSRRDVVRVARMFRILVRTLDLVTLGTRPVITHTTLPDRAQEPLAVGKGARPNKLALLVLNLSAVKTMRQLNLVPFEVVYVNLNVIHHFALFLCQSVTNNTRLELGGYPVLNSQGGESQIRNAVPLLLSVSVFQFELCYFGV